MHMFKKYMLKTYIHMYAHVFKTIMQMFVGFLKRMFILICSVQFSRSVVSDSLGPHELQHARPPGPSPTPGVHPNSCPLSQ